MQVVETLSEGLKRELKVVVPAADLEAEVEKRLAEMSRTIQMKGFRPGKVPLSLVRRQYRGAVLGEVIERQIQSSSFQAINERAMRPALQPKIEITRYDEGKDLEFKMNLEILPNIELGEFSSLALTRLTAEPADEDVTRALERIAENEQRFSAVSDGRSAKKGDQLLVDFKGTVAGAGFPGNEAKDFELVIGAGGLIPGFEEQLVGAKAGDARTLSLEFPKDYFAAEVAGKAAAFEVAVKEVRERQTTSIDDALAKRYQHDSLDAMRKAVRERLAEELKQLSKARLKRSLLDVLAERHGFPVPVGMVEEEFAAIWKQIETDVQRAGGDYDKALGKPEEGAKVEYREIAERRVRLGLLLAEIGTKNGITVEREDLLGAALASARSFPQPKQVLDFYRANPDALERFRAPVFEDKVVAFLCEMAKITEQAVTPAELMRDPDDEPEAGAAESKAEIATEKTAKGRRKKAAQKADSKPDDDGNA